MKQVGLEFETLAPPSEEKTRKGESPRDMVKRLALEKAHSLIGSINAEAEPVLVIAADTTVVAPDGKRVLGKPRDESEARSMLRTLSGRTHTVLTGYSIIEVDGTGIKRELVRVVSSRVKIRELSKSQIQAYVRTREPMDKAGSYAAQGIGMAFVERLSGSYTNVVGLPMSQLLTDLEKKFGIALFQNF